jgi:hypothetical protein
VPLQLLLRQCLHFCTSNASKLRTSSSSISSRQYLDFCTSEASTLSTVNPVYALLRRGWFDFAEEKNVPVLQTADAQSLSGIGAAVDYLRLSLLPARLHILGLKKKNIATVSNRSTASVAVCICMYVCVCVCTDTHTHTHKHTHTHTHTHTNTHKHTECMHACMYVCMMYVCMYV